MRHIPRQEIWSWIDADPEPRASYVANMAPKDFTIDDWNDSLIQFEAFCAGLVIVKRYRIQSSLISSPGDGAVLEALTMLSRGRF